MKKWDKKRARRNRIRPQTPREAHRAREERYWMAVSKAWSPVLAEARRNAEMLFSRLFPDGPPTPNPDAPPLTLSIPMTHGRTRA